VLPVPRSPRWAHHNTALRRSRSDRQGTADYIPDNGICERFHKTVLNEFYRVAFRKKVYRAIDELQADLDSWITEYNEARPHQGRWCFGKTPMQTFLDAMPMTKEKMIAA
jgi:transposase InsO family protein